MTYLPTMGAVDASNFNSTMYPGVCKPTNQATLDLFRALQQQINRVLYAKKLPLIAEDGDIGPGTLKALSLALGGSSAMTCSMLASQADAFKMQLDGLAQSLGAPASVVSPKPARPPSFLDLTTNLEVPGKPPGIAASLPDAFKNMSTSTMIVLGVVAAGAGYYLTRKPGPSKPSVRYRTRTRTRYITRRSRR